MERPSATFCHRKCNILNDFFHVELLAYYTLENKSNKTGKFQSEKSGDT